MPAVRRREPPGCFDPVPRLGAGTPAEGAGEDRWGFGGRRSVEGVPTEQAEGVPRLMHRGLGTGVLGVHPHGSAVLGGPRPHSDLDVLFALRRHTRGRRRAALVRGRPGRGGRDGPLPGAGRPERGDPHRHPLPKGPISGEHSRTDRRSAPSGRAFPPRPPRAAGKPHSPLPPAKTAVPWPPAGPARAASAASAVPRSRGLAREEIGSAGCTVTCLGTCCRTAGAGRPGRVPSVPPNHRRPEGHP